MMNKKLIGLMGATLVAGMLLVGCGGNNTEPTTAPTTTVATPTSLEEVKDMGGVLAYFEDKDFTVGEKEDVNALTAEKGVKTTLNGAAVEIYEFESDHETLRKIKQEGKLTLEHIQGHDAAVNGNYALILMDKDNAENEKIKEAFEEIKFEEAGTTTTTAN